MPAGITHLRFGQNKPKPGRKNRATGNIYRPCPSSRVPIENWILVHCGLRQARGKLDRPALRDCAWLWVRDQILLPGNGSGGCKSALRLGWFRGHKTSGRRGWTGWGLASTEAQLCLIAAIQSRNQFANALFSLTSGDIGLLPQTVILPTVPGGRTESSCRSSLKKS